MKILSIDRERCSGCGACQILCSLAKKGSVDPAESRIRIRRAGGADTQYPSVCQHCAEPVCVSACMRGIIDKDPATGVVRRRQEDCFACAACMVMCPHGAVVYDHDLDAFDTCDFCGGAPVCAAVCPTGALRYEEPGSASASLRGKYAARFFGRAEETQ